MHGDTLIKRENEHTHTMVFSPWGPPPSGSLSGPSTCHSGTLTLERKRSRFFLFYLPEWLETIKYLQSLEGSANLKWPLKAKVGMFALAPCALRLSSSSWYQNMVLNHTVILLVLIIYAPFIYFLRRSIWLNSVIFHSEILDWFVTWGR